MNSKSIAFLRGSALFALGAVLVGGVAGRGSIGHAPGNVFAVASNLRVGLTDGFMGLAVIGVLLAPPLTMLLVTIERRRSEPRLLWIALATTSVLVVFGTISAVLR